MTLPNLHHWLADLEPFGIPNDRQVYVSTTEPHGLIEATSGGPERGELLVTRPAASAMPTVRRDRSRRGCGVARATCAS